MRKFVMAVCFLLMSTLAFAVVNINTATVAKLTTLKGVGQKKAEAIVNYRQKNGAFKKADDLMKVKGIGNKLFAKISSDITVKKTK